MRSQPGWLVVALTCGYLMSACDSTRSPSAPKQDPDAALRAFATEHQAAVGWWDPAEAGSMTIHAQRALARFLQSPAAIELVVDDVWESNDGVTVQATAGSDAPEATYLMRLSSEDATRLLAPGEDLLFESVLCEARFREAQVVPLQYEVDGDNESRWVNLISDATLVVQGDCLSAIRAEP